MKLQEFFQQESEWEETSLIFHSDQVFQKNREIKLKQLFQESYQNSKENLEVNTTL